MLRITRYEDDGHELLKLEGKLLGPWVTELAQVCPAAPGRFRLDLSAVTFVDGAGVTLLRELLDRGAAVIACSGLVAELLHPETR